MKHIHRAHLKPLACDTNPAQFARQGNPWDGERVKVGRRKRRVPKCRPGLPKRLERDSRLDESEAMLDLRAKLELAQKLGKSPRTLAPLAEPKSPTLAILPSRSVELTRWQLFERQVTRCSQRAEVLRRLAEGKERMRLADEKARLKAILKATEARLAQLG